MAALQQISTQGDRGEEPTQFLTFLHDEELLALEVLTVLEIIEHRACTPVPTMPPWVTGVLDLRGAAVPVVDLSLRLGQGATRVTRRTCIIVVEGLIGEQRRQIGLMVDAVRSVIALAPGDIEAVPAFGVRINPAYLKGVGKSDGHFIKLLDVARLTELEPPARLAATA